MIYTEAGRLIELRGDGLENNPFLAWVNLGKSAALSGTAVLTGGERANAVSGSTYDKWRPNVTGATADLVFDFGSAAQVTFAALAAHNLASLGASVALQRSADGSTWVDAGCGTVTPTDDNPLAMRMLGRVAARYWRLLFSGLTAGDALAVGVAFLGQEAIIPRRIYQGFAPVLTPTEVELQSNVSAGGELLGSSVVLRGSTVSASVAYVPEAWVRGADWLAFQRAFNEGLPFFFAWRPTKHAGDLHYCARASGVIRPTNSGPRDLMQIDFEARVYAHG